MMVRRSILLSAAVFALFGADAVSAATASGQFDALHDSLHLRADQEGAWRTYLAAVTPSPDVENRRRAAAMMAATLETPRRVDLINAEMEADLREAHRQGEAVKAFYAALDADQKRAFDRMTSRAPDPSPSRSVPARRQN